MDDQNKGEIIMYQTEDGLTEIQTTLINDTVWLSANQMAELFQRDEKTIRKHINNVFDEGELSRENNTQKMRVVHVKQPVAFYNLDVIISVGYRVKSQRGTQFRIWANGVLKEYHVPVVMDVDLGHLPPSMPVISGGMAEVSLDPSGNGTEIGIKYL